jgi:hypothetical protein
MPGKSALSGGQRAKSSAIEPEMSTNAPDLRAIIDAWPRSLNGRESNGRNPETGAAIKKMKKIPMR